MQAGCKGLKSALNANRDPAQQQQLSWREARQAGAEWLATIGFPKKRDVKGEFVDLQPFGDSLDATGAFRQMVLQAAARLLKKRGAKSVILPP